MGAEQSALGDTYKSSLDKQEMRDLKASEKTRKASLRKQKSKSSYMGDVTAYPERAYSSTDLKEISDTLGERLDKINRKMSKLAKDDLAGYIKEYTTIREGKDATALASRIPQHKGLNRYNNIIAFDHTRVTVRPTPETANSDYINANFINGYNHPNRYIASQGPIPDSFNAFWQMIWENSVPTIVMVTQEVEGGKLKCHRYWPEAEEPGAMQTYGQFQVSHTGQEVYPLFVKRTFSITHAASKETRELNQYCYTAWPDHGVPQTTSELLQFRTTVRKSHDDSQRMLVHCSAGVGRTGTFIGLDRYLDSCANVDSKQDGQVLGVVRDMRASRNFMVQAQAQFVYLYEACRDGLAKLHAKATREYNMSVKDEQAKQQQVATELEADIAKGEAAITEMRRQWKVQQGGVGGLKIRADVTKEMVEQTTYTHDIHHTATVGQDDRRTSLAQSTTEWVGRRNVPLSPEEHGYAEPAPPLTSRLMALSDARTSWMTRYSEAERTWAIAHDETGVLYDVGQQMTPLESRVASLAAAEEAWMLRSGSALTLAEERQRLEVNDLTQRLESLQFTVLNTERRWRSVGHGFAESNQGPEGGEADGGRIHTSERLGGLTERLGGLQQEQLAWTKREQTRKYEVSHFHDEVSKVAAEQDNLWAKRMKAREEAEAAEAKAEEAAAADAKAVADAKAQVDRDAARRKGRKDRQAAASVLAVDPTDPEVKRKAAKKQRAEEEALAAEVAAMEAEEAELAAAAVKSKSAQKAKAAKQAKRFLKSGK